MGNCFSDPSPKHKGGQKLGSGPPAGASGQTKGGGGANRPPGGPSYGAAGSTVAQSPPRTLGGGGGAEGGDGGDGLDSRERALKAAEERAKSASNKGVTTSNPKSGQLSAKLAAERKTSTSPTQNSNERMMDRGDWN